MGDYDYKLGRIEERLSKIEKTVNEASENASSALDNANNSFWRTRELSYRVSDVEERLTAMEKKITSLSSILETIERRPAVQYETYKKALSSFEQEDYLRASKLFDSLHGYRDSMERWQEARKKAYHQASQLLDSDSVTSLKRAEEVFIDLGDYEESADLGRRAREKYTTILNEPVYLSARALLKSDAIDDLVKAEAEFEKISGYRDAEDLAIKAHDLVLERRYTRAVQLSKSGSIFDLKDAEREFRSLGSYRDSSGLARKAAEKIKLIQNNEAYQKACKLLESDSVDNLKEAEREFGGLLGFKDSSDLANKAHDKYETVLFGPTYQEACKLLESNSIENLKVAEGEFKKVSGYLDADKLAAQAHGLILEHYYQNACQLLESDGIDSVKKAENEFKKLGNYKDSKSLVTKAQDRCLEISYLKACRLLKSNKIDELRIAAEEFEKLGKYEDSKERAKQAKKQLALVEKEQDYKRACELLESDSVDDVKRAESILKGLGSFRNSKTLANRAPALILECRYKNACRLLESEAYDDFRKAELEFKEIASYKDSAELAWQAQQRVLEHYYQIACRLLDSDSAKDLMLAEDTFRTLGDFRDSEELLPKTVKKRVEAEGFIVGKTICFGSYPQGASMEIRPIVWRVLDVQDDRALVVAERAIEGKPFHETLKSVDWSTSSLRGWLNSKFLHTAFNSSESGRIINSIVSNNEIGINPLAGNLGKGYCVRDKVFCLSVREATRYFVDNESRICLATDFSKMTDTWVTGSCKWWLRSNGDDGRTAAYIDSDGSVQEKGIYVSRRGFGVRPAMWIAL